MFKIVIVGFDKALATAIAGIADILSLTGVSWNRIQQQSPTPRFDVKIASKDGAAIECINGLQLNAHISFAEIDRPSAIVIPTIGGHIPEVLAENPEVIKLIRHAEQQGWIIAANCTGNFLLAEAGVLDGRVATTHWGYEAQFKQRYPKVDLRTELMLTRDDNLFCAGGGQAWFDLALHMIEQVYGYDMALETAKAFVLDYHRDSQQSYSLLKLAKPHKDPLVKQVQLYLEKHFDQPLPLEQLATRFNISKRTLIRRFNQALDIAPNSYIQSLRIEAARKRLEQTNQTVEQVMNGVGYEDTSSFRRLFRSVTGLTPTEYRRRFGRKFGA
ncbi:GlxA family transcriptional regulator [Ferrimonas lipolytica]|uniref:Helix-turn-helix domain-containing protein n=1 Tax=Ferrimonas lipolytica TaxID=2724191 RepID=A0A6H1UCX7_9GAMM|nr:helix-turn-helix domain-containing protein [Ferrimonas lipolytica]QIZ76957.1 helix-turn-helix domain-containing protein [Ferrimonas lipolytica]